MKDRFKKLSKTGGVTIPADIRRDFGFNGGDGLSVTSTGDGGIIIRKSAELCFFCNSDKDCKKFMGRNICKNCRDAIAERIGTDGQS